MYRILDHKVSFPTMVTYNVKRPPNEIGFDNLQVREETRNCFIIVDPNNIPVATVKDFDLADRILNHLNSLYSK